MEYWEEHQPKAKRVRSNPTKKWTLAEEKVLIEFLMANRDFEKPTAQAYYRRFSAETKIEVDWKLTRAKVRNMRTSYNKAKAWEGSTGAGSMEGETIKAALLKKCTFFYELDDFFGTRLVTNVVIEDSLEPEPTIDTLDCIEVDVEGNLPANNFTTEIENEPSTSRKGIYSRTALSEILRTQAEMLKFKKEKVDKEFSLKEKEFALKEREINLKEKEIESNERLKIMELEMRERLQIEELNRKYK